MHIHSHWSDGDCSAVQLVKMAGEKGLSGIILTDHDTFGGEDGGEEAAEAAGILFHRGMEISCRQEDGRPLHLLAYGVPRENREMLERFCEPFRRSRDEAVRQSALVLEGLGFPVKREQVEAYAGPGGQLCKQYIMDVLIKAGLCQEMYGDLYRRIFKKHADGSLPLAPLQVKLADPFQALEAIRRSGGLAVLAHPGQYGNFQILPQLVGCGLFGIEAYHPKHDGECTRRCLNLARRYGLAVTGGSDYHGCFGEGEELGEWGIAAWPEWL